MTLLDDADKRVLAMLGVWCAFVAFCVLFAALLLAVAVRLFSVVAGI